MVRKLLVGLGLFVFSWSICSAATAATSEEDFKLARAYGTCAGALDGLAQATKAMGDATGATAFGNYSNAYKMAIMWHLREMNRERVLAYISEWIEADQTMWIATFGKDQGEVIEVLSEVADGCGKYSSRVNEANIKLRAMLEAER